MRISERGLQFIRDREKLELTAYQDSVGIWTLGYGHIAGIKEGDTCTVEQAEKWLLEDVSSIAEACVNKFVKVPLTQEQFDALCSWTFNLGGSALRNSTLLKKLNAGDYQGAANEFERWNHAGGKVVAGLTKRRLLEKAIFLEVA